MQNTVVCIISDKGAKPTVVQLAKGSVEEVQIKGQLHVLKLTSTLQGERSLYMSFASQSDYGKWLKKAKKVCVNRTHPPPPVSLCLCLCLSVCFVLFGHNLSIGGHLFDRRPVLKYSFYSDVAR